MFTPPRGKFSGIVNLVGYTIGILIYVISLSSLLRFIYRNDLSFLQILITVGIYVAILIQILLLFMGVFPETRVDEAGIKVRIFGQLTKMVRWDEIVDICDLNRMENYQAVIINRNSYDFILKGRWHNWVYGLIFGFMEPIVLISKYARNHDELISKFDEHKVHAHGLSVKRAYNSMVIFLEKYSQRKGAADHFGELLSDIQLFDEKEQVDSDVWEDWLLAVRKASKVDKDN
jgi:hypothetical protein